MKTVSLEKKKCERWDSFSADYRRECFKGMLRSESEKNLEKKVGGYLLPGKGFLKSTLETGAYFFKRLQELAQEYSIIKNVRGVRIRNLVHT